MIYLLLAIASSAMVSICIRVSEKYIKNEMGMFMANYAVCILLSSLFMNHQNTGLATYVAPVVIVLGIISGVLYLVSFVFLKMNMKHNGIVMASTFMKLGVLIPTVMAVVVFREMPEWTQVIGIVLSLLAIFIIHFEKEALHESSKKSWLILLLVLNGFTDSMANIFEQVGDADAKDGYLLITFITAFLLAMVFTFVNKEKVSRNDLLFGVLIGIPNYFSARFLLLALGSVDAVLVYPMYSVATIVIITLVGIMVFREKISKKKACAMGLIMVALCLLNISPN